MRLSWYRISVVTSHPFALHQFSVCTHTMTCNLMPHDIHPACTNDSSTDDHSTFFVVVVVVVARVGAGNGGGGNDGDDYFLLTTVSMKLSIYRQFRCIQINELNLGSLTFTPMCHAKFEHLLYYVFVINVILYTVLYLKCWRKPKTQMASHPFFQLPPLVERGTGKVLVFFCVQ